MSARLEPLRRRRASPYCAGPALEHAVEACRRPAHHGLASTIGYTATVGEPARSVADAHLAAFDRLASEDIDDAEHRTFTRPGLTSGGSIPGVTSVFEQPWWLDSVATGGWGEAVVRRGDDVVEQLPPFDVFRQSFSPALTNWLPFDWMGFRATVHYTYRIEDLSDLDRVQSDFQEHIRRGIRKAMRMVEVVDDCPLEELLRLDEQTYARQGLRTPHSTDVMRRPDAACAARDARRILAAIDAQGSTHAVLYVVWDDRTLYALINARDTERQGVGANTLLYWEAIRLAARVSRVFDFEGSMLEPVEHFFRGFGGRQIPYFCISKARLRAKPALAAWNTRHAVRRLDARRG